jgi:nucleotide-binding universal stress UspA family protein
MRTIVVPVNFSDNSGNAARYAADLALAIGAEISLINVFQPPTTISETAMPLNAFEELRDASLELLQSLSGELVKRTKNKVKITSELKIGGVEKRIESFCRRHKPFLVVMGASRDSLQNTLQGSGTVRALRHLPYPVLVIPEDVVFHAVKKIAIACDQEDIDSGMPETLPVLKEISEILKAQLSFVHVLTDGKENAMDAITEYDVWKRQIRAFGPEMHFVRQERVEDGIGKYLQDHEVDWLMVLPKKHSILEFHKSRAKQIVLHCPVPVISVHE